MGLRVEGLGLRVEGLGLRVEGLRVRFRQSCRKSRRRRRRRLIDSCITQLKAQGHSRTCTDSKEEEEEEEGEERHDKLGTIKK